jgi:hypothetical protein
MNTVQMQSKPGQNSLINFFFQNDVIFTFYKIKKFG